MKIAIIKSTGTNLSSICNAFCRLGVEPIVTTEITQIKNADRVILPGVGTAKVAMQAIDRDGLKSIIDELQMPVLGICLGMQILFEKTEEGNQNCLGLLKGNVKKFDAHPVMPVPHMGWNTISVTRNNGLIDKSLDGKYFYFVHSFYLPANSKYSIANSDYINPISAAVNYNNFWGCQFHPEKSGSAGMKILENFLELK